MPDILIKALKMYLEYCKCSDKTLGEDTTTKVLYESLFQELPTYTKGDIDIKSIRTTSIKIFLDSIYHSEDKYFELYNILINYNQDRRAKEKYRNFLKQLHTDYYETSRKIKKASSKYRFKELAQKLINDIEYTKSIDGNTWLNFEEIPERFFIHDIANFKRIITILSEEKLITPSDELIILECLDNYNKSILEKNNIERKTNLGTEVLKELSEFLKLGYQEHDRVNVSYKQREDLEKKANAIKRLVDIKNSAYYIEGILENYRLNYTQEEFLYIINHLLYLYQSDLILYYEFLMTDNEYRNTDIREETLNSFHFTLETYIKLMQVYNSYIEEKEEQEEVKPTKETPVPESKCKIIYSTPKNTANNSAYILDDINNLPNEYYKTILNLIDKFKEGTISPNEIKYFSSTNAVKSGTIELRKDQVRILIKHVKDDIYCVLGVFAKKADQNRKAYTSICARCYPKLDTPSETEEYLACGEQVSEELEQYIKQYARIGTR